MIKKKHNRSKNTNKPLISLCLLCPKTYVQLFLIKSNQRTDETLRNRDLKAVLCLNSSQNETSKQNIQNEKYSEDFGRLLAKVNNKI